MPASTGYGEPIQRLFKFKDGERIVAAASLDPRVVGQIGRTEGEVPPTHAVAVTTRRLQPALRPRAVRRAEHTQPVGGSRGSGEGAEVVGVSVVQGSEMLIAATARRARCSARSTR